MLTGTGCPQMLPISKQTGMLDVPTYLRQEGGVSGQSLKATAAGGSGEGPGETSRRSNTRGRGQRAGWGGYPCLHCCVGGMVESGTCQTLRGPQSSSGVWTSRHKS